VLVSGGCTNEEAYLGARLAREVLRTGNVDACLGPEYGAILRGLSDAGASADLLESLNWIEGSDRIFLLEGDLAVTHPEVALSVLRGVRRGASLVTLGLARTRMSQVAGTHILLDPGCPRFLYPGPLETHLDTHPPPGRIAVVLSPWTPDTEALSASVCAMAEYIGRIGRALGTAVRFLPLPIRANTRGAYEMGAAPGHLPGPRPLEDQAARDRLRSVWGADPAREAGTDAREMLRTVEGLVVVRDGCSAIPSTAMWDASISPTLKSLVVLDAFRSPASDAATVALPIGGLSETDGTFTSGLGRVQRIRAANAPPNESRQGWEVLSGLMGLLGSQGRYSSAAEVFSEIQGVIPAYGVVTSEALDEGWGETVRTALGGGNGRAPEGSGASPEPHRPGPPPAVAAEDGRAGKGDGEAFGTHWLVLDGAFEWSEDAMVQASPTLRRDGMARRKLHPRGFVVMNPSDGSALGVREGWVLRLRSRGGEALVPVSLSPRAGEGFLLIPPGFRQLLSDVLGASAMERVEVERA